MIGQARFTYTDDDMIATQRAGWTWVARWRNLLVVFVGIALFENVCLAGLNASYGTRGAASALVFVMLASAILTVLIFGMLVLIARNHGRQVLRRTARSAWDGDELGGEHAWAWDGDRLHIRHERGRTDLSWNVMGGWLDGPQVLLLFPSGGRAFTLSEQALTAGWRDAPKVFLFPFGGHALALPKRALAPGDGSRVIDILRRAGTPERRRFGLVATKGLRPR